ncbi:hypothetical protein PI125_g18694 [Phytophthora idaei]|nr:hypothetical protein PI125_g18694 [Phytophthora idaei]KAG3137673.1 hypothetical protein PI126_g17282 [Phytophthora idaei]
MLRKQEEPGRQEESGKYVVNNAIDVDPRNYREAMRSRLKRIWLKAMLEELRALEANGAWEVVRLRRGVRVLHTKWVYKTK